MFKNYKGEKIIYINHHSGKGVLSVFLAGVTTPNPDYKSIHNTTKYNEFDKYQLEYVFKGKGYIEAGNEKYEVTEGDFFFLNKLKQHIYYTDKNNLLEKIFITVNGSLMDGLVAAYGMNESVIISRVNVFRELSDIHSILGKTNMETHENDLNKIALIVHEIFQKIRMVSFNAQKEQLTEAERIQNYIENHLDTQITLENLAESFFKSKTHIIRLFKSRFSETPVQYALKRKIESAKHILTYTDLTIDCISEMLAFSSNKHFSQVFKKIIGMPPKDYRKKFKQNLSGIH